MKIIAFDFDGVIAPRSDAHNGSGTYPTVTGEPRKYAKEVINHLRNKGVTVVIWTCREDEDLDCAVDWMEEHNINYDGINMNANSWMYDARKIFAHMYVDDRAFGWVDSESVMLNVLRDFMVKECGMAENDVIRDIEAIRLEVD